MLGGVVFLLVHVTLSSRINLTTKKHQTQARDVFQHFYMVLGGTIFVRIHVTLSSRTNRTREKHRNEARDGDTNARRAH